MGWDPRELGRPRVPDPVSTQGGIRAADGTPDRARLPHRPLGGRPADAGGRGGAARRSACMPFAGFCTDPCDGRTQGTAGMMDSLAYRNDAAHGAAPPDPLAADAQGRARRRHLRQGPAGDDDGAGRAARPAVRAGAGRRDAAAAARARTRARCRPSARASPTARSRSSEAAELGCRACASPGGGCQFLGTAATSQVVGEALGLSLPHSRAGAVGPADLARHGARARPARWLSLQSARPRHARHPDRRRGPQRDGGPRGVRRLDQPAAAHPRHRARGRACGGRRWTTGSTSTGACRGWSTRCRTGRVGHPTVRVFLAGGVPEVMLHLRRARPARLDGA